jgi:pyruvate/2-oxoglutarate dehydrogenase complex dihydrolipoamide acyltransferase (E2) component
MGPVSKNELTEIVLLCDHRVIDGVLAAKALETLEKRLGEIPRSLAKNEHFP